MEKYYDLVMANVIADYKKEGVQLDLPGTGFTHLPEKEKWEKVKESFAGCRLGVITEWGLIDFDPEEKKTLVGGEDLSYEEYLDLQMQSGHKRRSTFEKAYYDAAFSSFKGKIERILAKKNRICFEKIYVAGQYPDGDGFVGKEDHVWIDLSGFGKFRVGDCIQFDADIYRYVKTGSGRSIDFGLRNPSDINQITEYDLPSDDELRLQAVDEIICNDLCLFSEHCSGVCLANEKWRDSMREFLLGTK